MPKRNMKIPLIYHAIGYLTHYIDFSIPIRLNKLIFIQSQCNINMMFKLKKNNENVKPSTYQKKPKQKKSIQLEQTNDRFSIINDIDQLIR